MQRSICSVLHKLLFRSKYFFSTAHVKFFIQIFVSCMFHIYLILSPEILDLTSNVSSIYIYTANVTNIYIYIYIYNKWNIS
jgi:hypothetical protein